MGIYWTDEDLISDEELMARIRGLRNSLLKRSDFSQLPDYPGDKDAWALYRQQLRDLPNSAPLRQIVIPKPPIGGN